MTVTNNETTFATNQWYAIFAGWLIVPIILAFMDFLGAIIMVALIHPSHITGTDLIIYYGDLIKLPLLILTFIMLFLRKRLFPIIINIYFAFAAIVTLILYQNGLELDVFQLAVSFVWIVYFIRSERVKATFTK